MENFEFRQKMAKAQVLAAVFAPVSMERDEAARLVKYMKSDVKAEREDAELHLLECAESVLDLLCGNYTPVVKDGLKSITSSYLPVQEQIVQVFTSTGNERYDFDSTWMSVFETDPLYGNNRASIAEVIESTEAFILADATSPIPASKFRSAYWETYERIWMGSLMNVANDVLESDPLTTINNVVAGMRLAMIKRKTTTAFEYTNFAIDAANTAGQVTPLIGGNLAKTINEAVEDLLDRLEGKGYNIGDQFPVYLWSNRRLRAEIEAVFAITRNSLNSSGNVNGTITVNMPDMGRLYSRALARDLDLGGNDAFVLVAPGKRNRMGLFRAQKSGSQYNLLQDTTDLAMRESFGFTADSDQFQIVTM